MPKGLRRAKNNMRYLSKILYCILAAIVMASCVQSEMIAGSMQYLENISLVFMSNSTFEMDLAQKPWSVWLLGKARGSPDINAYLISDKGRFLLFNSSDLSEAEPLIDYDIGEYVRLINSTYPEKTRGIVTTLKYADIEGFIPDEDGKAHFTSAMGFSVDDTHFDFEADYQKACTVWQIYSVFNANMTTLCHGSKDCCATYGLMPQANTIWNSGLYLSYARFGASEKNVVSAKVAYFDVQLDADVPKYDINIGQWDFLPAYFYEPLYYIEPGCRHSCGLDLGSESIGVEIEVPYGSRFELDAIRYVTKGRNISLYADNTSVFSPTVRCADSSVCGHYDLLFDQGERSLIMYSYPKTLFSKGNVTHEADWDPRIPRLENPTKHHVFDPQPRPLGKIEFHGLEKAVGDVDVYFYEANDTDVSTPIISFNGNISSISSLANLARYDDVIVISRCVEFSDNMTCKGWEPHTSDFNSEGDKISFGIFEPGTYAGLKTGFLDYFIKYGDEPSLKSAPAMDSPVEWELDISTRYGHEISFDVFIATPPHAESVSLVENSNGSKIELIEHESEDETAGYKASLSGGRNYTLFYSTQGPKKTEIILADDDDVFIKDILIRSDIPFSKVQAYTGVPSVPRNSIMMYAQDGAVNMAHDPRYNLTFEDSDGDGNVNWAHWLVDDTADQVFTVYADMRLLDREYTRGHALTRLNEDGLRSTMIAGTPISRIILGDIRPYDTNVISTREGSYKAADVDHDSRFPMSLDSPIVFGSGASRLLSHPLGANPVPALVGGDTVAYYGAWESTDLIYILSERGAKERIVMNNESSPIAYSFKLDLQGLSIHEDGIYELHDREGNLVFTLSKPYAYDSRGRRGPVSDSLERRNMQYYYIMEANGDFLERAKYPVTIDPSFDLADSQMSMDGDTDGSVITSDALTMLVGYDDFDIYRSFLEFNVSSIPDYAILESVSLRIYNEFPMDDTCSQCAIQIRHMDQNPSHYGSIGSPGGLFTDIGNGTVYSQIDDAHIYGSKDIALGAQAVIDLRESLDGGLFSLGLISSDETAISDMAALSTSRAPYLQRPALVINWYNDTTGEASNVYFDSMQSIVDSFYCRLEQSLDAHVCQARNIIVNGTVDLLFDDEDDSRSLILNVTGNITVSEQGKILADGRSMTSTSSMGDAGDITLISSENADIFGLLSSTGGSYISGNTELPARCGGKITVISGGRFYSTGNITADGGDIGVDASSGTYGGCGGMVSINSTLDMHISQISVESGISNLDESPCAGNVSIYSDSSITSVKISAAGGYSRLDSGGSGGAVHVSSPKNIVLGHINASGGDGLVGAGGQGGSLFASSFYANLTFEGVLALRSGSSQDSINRPSGSVNASAKYGHMRILSDIDVSGGHELGSGVAADGGRLSLYGRNFSVTSIINASGADADGGFGGGGGIISIGYCGQIEDSSAQYDISGGTGTESSGSAGTLEFIADPIWCSFVSGFQKIILNSPADGSSFQADNPTLNVTISDPGGDDVDVSIYGRNQTSDFELLYHQSGVQSGQDHAFEWTGSGWGLHHWFVNVTDGTNSTQTGIWTFELSSPGNIAPVFGYILIQPSFADTYLEYDSDIPLGGQSLLQVGRETEDYYRSLLAFNISDIPQQAVITRSHMQLFLFNGTYPVKGQARNLTAQWDPDHATWLRRTETEFWTAPGGDYE